MVMAIWYMCIRKDKKYLKFIMFNSGAVKLVNNDNLKRSNQYAQKFTDGANFLDAITNLFSLTFLDLSELAQWIIEHY